MNCIRCESVLYRNKSGEKSSVSYERIIKAAMGYIDTIYRIEIMKANGVGSIYGLEQHRIKKHEELCGSIGIDKEKTKDICKCLDKSIGFNLSDLRNDYHYLEKYAKLLVHKLETIK